MQSFRTSTLSDDIHRDKSQKRRHVIVFAASPLMSSCYLVTLSEAGLTLQPN